jgi:apolipoprotein D and lipocalin family protein
LASLPFLLAGCTGIPEGLTAVRGFEPDRYLGRWYEIARLDHRFERGLVAVTATYGRNPDGSLRVLNRGFDPRSGSWKEAEGRAEFLGPADVASLRVSFFGPFYGGYHVIALDRDAYRWAMVAGPSREYLWLLARTPQLPPERVQALVRQATRWGFPTEGLILVEHPAGDSSSRP